MVTTRAADAPLAAVHVDLDGARHIFRAHGWHYDAPDDPLFETGLQGALEALALARVRATLFVIVEDMFDVAKRRMVRAAVEAGHEIACHSMTHRRLTALTLSAKRDEIAESRGRLAAALATDVRGFRAPGFHVDRECLEIIADAGYSYDSSILSGTALDARPNDGAPARPVSGKPLVELHLPSLRSLPFHPSYSLVVGNWYFTAGVHDFRRTNAPFVLLFHLTDFAEPLPAAKKLGWRQQLFTLSHLTATTKRARCAAMLETVRSRFTVTTTTELLAAVEPTCRDHFSTP